MAPFSGFVAIGALPIVFEWLLSGIKRPYRPLANRSATLSKPVTTFYSPLQAFFDCAATILWLHALGRIWDGFWAVSGPFKTEASPHQHQKSTSDDWCRPNFARFLAMSAISPRQRRGPACSVMQTPLARRCGQRAVPCPVEVCQRVLRLHQNDSKAQLQPFSH